MMNEINKSFIKLIEEIDSQKRAQRDRGTLFELLSVVYLKNEPVYARLFEEVWNLKDVPTKYQIPKVDTGVDLVAKKSGSNELVAIQCKYYSLDTSIQKSHIDSFLNEVGRSYYSEGLIITTTDKWTKNADESLKNRNKNIMRISLSDLAESQLDWASYSFEKPKEVKLKERKTPRPHQKTAIESVIQKFKLADRGKLVMAPGTGKTFTSMAIAEEMAKEKKETFKVLYLVPSIQLLSQTLKSWNADAEYNIQSIAVCSDRKVTKEKSNNEIEDIAVNDLGYPATTNSEKLLEYQNNIEENKNKFTDFITVFSTYQSIDVIIEAQINGFYDFDLIICDEAHRTTGTTESGQESSVFTKIHSNENIKGEKRLYQTATPRVYGEDAKKKAEEKSVIVADMNDPNIYGEEFHRIGFGDAIRQGVLTDYKVMVLAVDETAVARRFQKMLASEAELNFNDVTKIIGCWNGLVKRDGNTNKTLGNPMQRAIAFTGTIKESKRISEMFSEVVEQYINTENVNGEKFNIEIDHADGSMNALEKNKKISWLKSSVPDNTCRILSNARFLTEGVDVPGLDAVMFLKPRKSKIDIAQAVGRVMRKAEAKEYGYVILPIGIPAGAEAHTVLDNNEKYKVVWEVLNALRSLDERFDATINKLELNKKKPDKIQIIGVGDAPNEELETPKGDSEQLELDLNEEELSDLERAIYGKIVNKVGNVRYWEDWSKDVAEIAQRHIMRINVMLEDKESNNYKEFQKFIDSLRNNINNSITEEQAIEMLAQHLITKPIFEALFGSYSFVNNNPVSQAMEAILGVLDKQGLMKDQEKLEEFYDSVRVRAEGVDNLEAKQKIIIQLYDKFFKVGFKETTERLGIVFTPVEVVDFIIKSVEEVLNKYFGKSIKDKNVHILDPFTGTGTFITRLIQSDLISKEDLFYKYTQEIHANEIVLLSYYIAAINIEETFHAIHKGDYTPFEGIVLTDTFESSERQNSFEDELFNENNKRLKGQQENPIFAIIGNPPYSAGQKFDNDSNANVDYPQLEDSIEKSYAFHTKAKMKKTLYDYYIMAFRWASNRLSNKGIIAFVTNASYIDGQATDGLRKCLYEEFNYLYIFNLRGDQRTQGEKSRSEGGKIFGSGSRAPIAISILIRDGSNNHEIFYRDIDEYLTREQKLHILSEKSSIQHIDWEKIIPDKNNDWINQRDLNYENFVPLQGEKLSVFNEKLTGINSSRDAWVYGFNKNKVKKNVLQMVENYNYELKRLNKVWDPDERLSMVSREGNYINWSRSLREKFSKGYALTVSTNNIKLSMYRPFVKKWLFYDNSVVEMPGKYHRINFQGESLMVTTGLGTKRDFSILICNQLPNFDLLEKGQNYIVGELASEENLFGNDSISNISLPFKKELGVNSDEDTFNYIYGLLHSPVFRKKYANDLRKRIPRIPIVEFKEEYINVGRKLVDLHLNYESVPPYEGVTVEEKNNPSYKVNKMKHPNYRNKEGKLVKDTSIIVFNNDITILEF